MAKERKYWNKGKKTANYYEKYLEKSIENPLSQCGSGPMKKIIKPEEMPWEISRHGRIKHMINQDMCETMNIPAKSVDLYIQEILPGGYTGKHRHMSEECVYILEGKGYDIHWDVDLKLKDKYQWVVKKKGKKFEWEAGDVVYIPINTIHQHFNSDSKKSVRIISAVNRIYNHLGYGYYDLEQLEDSSDNR